MTMALVGDMLPPGRRAAALGLVGAIDTLGWVMGPLWGALLVEIGPGQESWRWVFVVNLPLAFFAAVAIGRAGGANPPAACRLGSAVWTSPAPCSWPGR